MSFSYSPLPEQYRRIQEKLEEKSLDAMIAFSPDNFYWASGALVETMRSIPDRLGAVLSILGEDPVLLTCSIEESLVADTTWIKDIRTYTEFTQSPVEILAQIITQKGLANSRIGIEKDFIVAKFYEELISLLPNVTLIDISRDYLLMRMVKTATEIELLGKAAYLTEKAITTTFWESRPGDREMDVLNSMIVKTLQNGGVAAFGSFGAGPKSAIAHPFADESPLRAGDIVSVDFGAGFNGYYSDIGRTAVVGSYSSTQDKIYTSLYDVQRRLIELVKPGLRANQLYFKALEWLRAAGIDLSLSHVGHGLGIGLHEEPIFSPICEIPLQEGMVINIEPFYVTNEGYHAEDTMVVTSEGAKLLSTFADHSKIICITDKK